MVEQTENDAATAAEVDAAAEVNASSLEPSAKTAADLPRRSLRELMDLAAQCAAREAALEKDHTAATDEVNTRESRTLSDLQGNLRHVQHQVAQKFQQQQQEAQATRDQQTQAARTADALICTSSRSRLDNR